MILDQSQPFVALRNSFSLEKCDIDGRLPRCRQHVSPGCIWFPPISLESLEVAFNLLSFETIQPLLLPLAEPRMQSEYDNQSPNQEEGNEEHSDGKTSLGRGLNRFHVHA